MGDEATGTDTFPVVNATPATMAGWCGLENERWPGVSLVQAMLDASYDGLCILDASARVLGMNEACERLTGIRRSESVGRNFSELKGIAAKAHWQAGHSLIQQVLDDKSPATTLVNAANDEMWLVTANPHVGADNQIQHLILNLRNITQLNYLKYQLERGQGHAGLADLERFRAGYLQSRLHAAGFGDVVVESPIMNRIISTITQVADFDTTVLLTGETGTGKGVLAQVIHRLSRRAQCPFIEVNCGALPESLVESELYGYEAGAFTGSLRSGKKGKFELAHGGTIFLDEISELPLTGQTKLLKCLDDKVIHPLGATTAKRVDVRIVAATNKNLRELTAAGKFRNDLLYRLEVIPLYVPALRERREDIKALIYSCLQQSNRDYGLDRALGSEAVRLLLAYRYPGNVRELKNLLVRLVLTARGNEITVYDLPDYVRAADPGPRSGEDRLDDAGTLPVVSQRRETPGGGLPGPGGITERGEHEGGGIDLWKELSALEGRLLARYAQECRSTYELAGRLGVSQSSVVRKLRKHGISLAS